jgi:hypothetical protein
VGLKNITFRAEEYLIEQARRKGKAQGTTLNAVFREWLAAFAAKSSDGDTFDALMHSLKHLKAPRHFSRDELNER